MPTNPMFYRSVSILNRDTHRALRLARDGQDFAYAARTHVIPAVVDEITLGARYLPILFVPGAPTPAPVFLVGLKPGENLFVGQGGEWRGGHVPTYLRRYPFMLGEAAEGAKLACVDDRFPNFGRAEGVALFNEDGTESQFLQDKIRLINEYSLWAKRTDAFVKALQDLQLLQAVSIDVRARDGASHGLHGLNIISEARLDELTVDEFQRLRAEGFLPAIYAHLLSLKSIDALKDVAFGTEGASKASATPIAAASQNETMHESVSP
jgi:hypothetical protein